MMTIICYYCITVTHDKMGMMGNRGTGHQNCLVVGPWNDRVKKNE